MMPELNGFTTAEVVDELSSRADFDGLLITRQTDDTPRGIVATINPGGLSPRDREQLLSQALDTCLRTP